MTHVQLLGIAKHRFVTNAIGLQHNRRGVTNTLCCHYKTAAATAKNSVGKTATTMQLHDPHLVLQNKVLRF
jgi:hypothetical protein